MELELVTWKIRGIRPLMQTNYREMMDMDTGTEGKVKARTKHRDKPFDEAKKQLYNGGDHYWHPSLSFWRAILDNCTGRTIGSVAASSVIPKAIMPLEEEFALYDPETLDGKKPRYLKSDEWQMDSRRVVNEKAGALIVHRPKWPKWGGFLTFEVDREFIKNLNPLTEILNIAGRYGVGAGRMAFNNKTKKWGGLGLGKFEAELK